MKRWDLILLCCLFLAGCKVGLYSNTISERLTAPAPEGKPGQVIRTVQSSEKGFLARWEDSDSGLWGAIQRFFGLTPVDAPAVIDKPVEQRLPGESIEEWRKRTGRD